MMSWICLLSIFKKEGKGGGFDFLGTIDQHSK